MATQLSAGDQERASRALKRSIIKRDFIVSQFRIISALGSKVEEDASSLPIFEARAYDLQKLLSEFHAEQDSILEQLISLGHESEFSITHAPIETQIMEQYYLIKALVAGLNINTSAVDNSASLSRQRNNNIQLPKIHLPSFDGNLLKWCSYRDTFLSLVHDNTILTETEKFHYLISTISGSAASIVKAVPLTEANYHVAWEALLGVYDNKRVLLTNHLDVIFHTPIMASETLTGLTEFLSTVRENLAAIIALEVKDLAGFLLFYIASRALPSTTKRLFETENHTNDAPNIDLLLKFVQTRCQILQNSACVQSLSNKTNPMKFNKVKATSLTAHLNSKACKYCKGGHFLHQCTQFNQLSVNQRFKFAQSQRLCMNCLSPQHKTGDCTSIHSCRSCSGKHHTLLHLEKGVSKSTTTENPKRTSVTQTSPSNVTNETSFTGAASSPGNVILGTAMIRIQSNEGHWVPIRALLDTGSQISIITSAFVSRLGLKCHSSHISVTGLSQAKVSPTKGATSCTLTSIYSESFNLKCEPMILSRIVGAMPSSHLHPEIRQAYSHIRLADPEFDLPASIDFLLGADIYPLILGNCSRVIHTPNLPSAYETTLGWIILGQDSRNQSSSLVSLLLTTEPSISHLINKFWETEEPSPPVVGFTDDKICEEHFLRTTTRDSSGRFSVALPFRDDTSKLGDSRLTAISRFYNLERKLQRETLLYEEYRKFMSDYERLGHMHVVSGIGKYYIPHHAVVKQAETQMKLRVVFDASAGTTSGKSLNELLYVGPKLQLDIAQLLHRCRFLNYMFTADICKMYRQIRVHNEDRLYQRIVWRHSPSEELKEFELNTVTYGVSSSPFQAIRVLHQLQKEEGHRYPYADKILTTQTYVDDIITGHNEISGLLRCRTDLIQLLNRAGFKLKKWSSNCSELMQQIPQEDRATAISFDPKEDLSLKILGMHWDPTHDLFTYHASTVNNRWTKRTVLSAIAKLYDPLGALAPITFWAKCFMQTLWQSRLEWDEILPRSLAITWQEFSTELPLVSHIKIHRHISTSSLTSVQLLGFADASEKGYAAVVYIRLIYDDGQISIRLITAKSKVAPLKTGSSEKSLTIPRLELCGALLLAQTLQHLVVTLHDILNITEIYAWTDSQIVLSWLTTQQSIFKVFVTNRLAKIKELIPSCQWHYVPSLLNPADCVSRGLLPSQLTTHTLYWQGPSFLRQSMSDWPDHRYETIPTSDLPEVKNLPSEIVCSVTIGDDESEWYNRFSTLIRLQRVTAHILRFYRLTRRLSVNTGPFLSDELDQALYPVIRNTQKRYFFNLTQAIRSKEGKISPRSIAQLTPFLDENDIIRVGGRLQNSMISFERQCPILMPKSSTLTTLLIRHYHLVYLHAGTTQISVLLSKKFWVISSRTAIRQVIFQCVVCARHRAIAPQPAMANLPFFRVNPSRPFSQLGIDFAGPFFIKESRRKNAKITKCYIAVYVCMAVKAVHLEVVSDLTTDAFLASLQRVVARRGIPSDIYTDCGTNFKGAYRQLQQLFILPSAQTLFANAVPCRWHFNPPAAPHFGGLWEAAVKSTKYHLKRVIGVQHLTFEELATLATRVEAILNSRPMTALSTDPNDLQPLTPGHFLIGQALVDLPEKDLTDVPTNRLHRWELLRQLHQTFWKRWSNEYLTTLQGRVKWTRQQPNIEVGNLVLINSPNVPPTHWKLGRVDKIHPGEDGIVRVVTVRTAEGNITRPVVKLAVLPIDT